MGIKHWVFQHNPLLFGWTTFAAGANIPLQYTCNMEIDVNMGDFY